MFTCQLGEVYIIRCWLVWIFCLALSVLLLFLILWVGAEFLYFEMMGFDFQRKYQRRQPWKDANQIESPSMKEPVLLVKGKDAPASNMTLHWGVLFHTLDLLPTQQQSPTALSHFSVWCPYKPAFATITATGPREDQVYACWWTHMSVFCPVRSNGVAFLVFERKLPWGNQYGPSQIL